MKGKNRYDPNKSVQCLEVVITKLQSRGKGVKDDPIYSVIQIWSKEGRLIAESGRP